MAFKRRFKDKYAGSSPENASVVRTLFDLFLDERDEYNIAEREVERQKIDVLAAVRELVEEGTDWADKTN